MPRLSKNKTLYLQLVSLLFLFCHIYPEGEQGQEIVKQLLTDALETDEDDMEMHLTGR